MDDLPGLRARIARGTIIDELALCEVLDRLLLVLLREDNLLFVQTPLVVCGDIHGQLEDLQELFVTAERASGHAAADGRARLAARYLFMGDYVDRGHFSLNTLLFLAAHKLERPADFFLLRGNHESRQVTQQYGFYQETLTKYGHTGVWGKAMLCFDALPVAALIDGRVFAVHGGLSPDVVMVARVLAMDRRREIPEEGPLADLTWSDPEEIEALDFRPNHRGAGFVFGPRPVKVFNHLNRIVLVTRSHQLVQNGFRWYYKDGRSGRPPEGRLINVWSAPNYGYTSGNLASVLILKEPNTYETVTFAARTQRLDEKRDVRPDERYFT
jgi:diadenosine tetraphosphatase ApaH/serine/threonine PP2A family protein phosphatase